MSETEKRPLILAIDVLVGINKLAELLNDAAHAAEVALWKANADAARGGAADPTLRAVEAAIESLTASAGAANEGADAVVAGRASATLMGAASRLRLIAADLAAGDPVGTSGGAVSLGVEAPSEQYDDDDDAAGDPIMHMLLLEALGAAGERGPLGEALSDAGEGADAGIDVVGSVPWPPPDSATRIEVELPQPAPPAPSLLGGLWERTKRYFDLGQPVEEPAAPAREPAAPDPTPSSSSWEAGASYSGESSWAPIPQPMDFSKAHRQQDYTPPPAYEPPPPSHHSPSHHHSDDSSSSSRHHHHDSSPAYEPPAPSYDSSPSYDSGPSYDGGGSFDSGTSSGGGDW